MFLQKFWKGIQVDFYLRKSLKAGPFRFNFSKSGVGVSVGVKGLRIGSGPRGNYIHAGVGGFYYRASLSPQSQNAPKYNPKYDKLSYDDLAGMHEIDSGNPVEIYLLLFLQVVLEDILLH